MTKPIPALFSLRPLLPLPSGAAPRLPMLGQALPLQIGVGPDGELLAQGPQGLLFTLPAGSARVGDLLLMRVVATQPQIELQLIEHQSLPTARLRADEGDGLDAMPSLRPDQAQLQRLQLGRGASETLPATLAAQWRSRVLAEVLRHPAEAALLPGLGGNRSEPTSALAPLYPMPGWQQLTILLRLLSPTAPAWPQLADELLAPGEGDAGDQAEEQGLRLQLSLTLEGESLQLLLQWQHGLLLYFVTESLPMLQALRLRLPQIASVLASIPMPLRYCLFARQLPAGQRPAARPSQGLAHTSSAALFRAAAEIVAVLQREPLLASPSA